VHDAQFLSHERAVADDYGHSTVDDAVGLAVAARVRTLALFHHAPARTDDEVEAIGRGAAGPGIEVIVAREGEIVEIGEGEGEGTGAP
jgi:ribonuclease BN (tRNA processing enzyme)